MKHNIKYLYAKFLTENYKHVVKIMIYNAIELDMDWLFEFFRLYIKEKK